MSTWYAGLDLGQAADYTALAIVEVSELLSYDPARVSHVTTTVQTLEPWMTSMGLVGHPGRSERSTRRVLLRDDGSYGDVPEADGTRLDVRHLQRWKLGTSYPTIVEEVCALMGRAPLHNQATLVVDGTGVGRPVVDLFSQRPSRAFSMTPVMITGGNATSTDEWGYTHIPKRDLVSCVQVALQNKRLRFAANLPELHTLQAELSSFQYKITNAGNDSYGAWREGSHDDLLLATALAVHQAEHAPKFAFWWVGDE